jgi:hypothetical protein
MVSKSSNPMHFDKRVVERFIRAGAITREDYEQHLSALPDVEAQSEPLVLSVSEDAEDAEGARDDEDAS